MLSFVKVSILITLRASMQTIGREKNKPKKVLVIRFSALGDLVLITPVLRALKEQVGAEVHVITKDVFKPLLLPNPHVDKIWTIGEGMPAVITQLQAEKFDHVLDLHKNLRSLRIRLALWRVPVSSYHKANWAKWLMVHFKINRLPGDHIVERYLAAAHSLGVKPDGRGLDFYIPEKQKINLNELGLVSDAYTALVIGAAHFTKRLPIEKLLEITGQIPGKVVLIGGPAEKETGLELQKAYPGKVLSTCGVFSLMGSASMVEQSHAVIAHDTGFMHIAAALRKPVVAIFGGTLAEYGFWPYYGNEPIPFQNVEVANLPCRPCSRFGRGDCPKGHFKCMMEIRPEQVVQAWQEIQ